MVKFYYIFFFFIVFQLLAAQDSLSKYTPEQFGYKSSMATRFTNKPLLWKTFIRFYSLEISLLLVTFGI